MQGGNNVGNTWVYQRVVNTADEVLSGAPKGGGAKLTTTGIKSVLITTTGSYL